MECIECDVEMNHLYDSDLREVKVYQCPICHELDEEPYDERTTTD